MSMDRQHGKIIWICDDCDGILETETDDFNEARLVLKDNGWITKKTGGGYEHYCEQCHDQE